ncbi:MAG: response regulator transcription factor [Sphingomonadaceae bacterium]|nr:response regulator transcription factor [Sphingomonadaceae bacterium]
MEQEPASKGAVRVAIVEDDDRLRAHFERTIGAAAGMALSWSASTLAEARERMDDLPQVALVDLGLPDGNGSELIAEMQARGDVKVLVVTIFDDRHSVLKAIHSGAEGYLVKESSGAEIVSSIETLVDGGSPISAAAAIHLMDMVRKAPEPAPEVPAEEAVSLTPRETELLQLFAKGLTYREAAECLGISRHTVGDHMKSIYRKLAVRSRSEAVFEAYQNRLIDL